MALLDVWQDVWADVWQDVWGEVPDTTPPNLSSPGGAATSSSTADGQVTTDEANGTLYWVMTQSATQPTVGQVQAGQDHTGSAADDSGNQAVTVEGVESVSASGLSSDTTYYFHFQQQDAATNDSSVVTSAAIYIPEAGGETSRDRMRRSFAALRALRILR